MRTGLLRRALTQVAPAAAVAVLLCGGCRGSATTTDAEGAPAAASSSTTAATSASALLGRTWTTTKIASPTPAVPGAAAAEPQDAVTRFVQAEADRNAEAAWSLLSAADRLRYPTAAVWQTEHRQLPWLTTVRLDGQSPTVGADGTTITVHATVHYEAVLDPVKGLVPATADADWRVVAEDGGWRIAFAASRFEPVLPADTDAAAGAAAWATARMECRTTDRRGARVEVTGGVVGIAGLAQRLCHASGDIRVGTPEPLAPGDAAAVVAAFGGSALTWARTVRIDGAVPQRVVLGPLGDRWIAVGVLAA